MGLAAPLFVIIHADEMIEQPATVAAQQSFGGARSCSARRLCPLDKNQRQCPNSLKTEERPR
jgi:hypothetical protein